MQCSHAVQMLGLFATRGKAPRRTVTIELTPPSPLITYKGLSKPGQMIPGYTQSSYDKEASSKVVGLLRSILANACAVYLQT